MDEPKLEQLPTAPQSERLLELLRTSAELFCVGEDLLGIDSLAKAAASMRSLVEADRKSHRPQLDLSMILPPLRTLYSYIHNQDITGVTDYLEDTFCAQTEQWMRGGLAI